MYAWAMLLLWKAGRDSLMAAAKDLWQALVTPEGWTERSPEERAQAWAEWERDN